MRTKKKLTAVFVIFCFILMVGIVWAELNGTLTFEGTAKLNFAALEIEYNDDSEGIGEVSDVIVTGQKATIYVDFYNPGDYVTCNFEIKNIGSVDAKIIDIINLDVGDGITISDNFDDDIKDKTIEANEYSEKPYSITIKWDGGVSDGDQPITEASFAFEMFYEQVTR